MRTILLDEGVPVGVVEMLRNPNRNIFHLLGSAGRSRNDKIVLDLAAMTYKADVFVTCDQNLVLQQNILGVPFGILVICTNNWPTIFGNRSLISQQVDSVRAGTVVAVLQKAHKTRYGRKHTLTDPDP